MGVLESLKIDLKDLKEGGSTLVFHLGDDYFKAVGGSEVKGGAVDFTLTVHRTAGFYELDFHVEGTVRVSCDICLDDMEQPVEADNRLTVRLGEEYAEDDDLITVSKDEGRLDVSWFVYEFIVLSVPIKHKHELGGCNPEMVCAVRKYSAGNVAAASGNVAVDPRWSVLEKLVK